jgi:Amt family ammonium transporter
MGIAWAVLSGFVVYGSIRAAAGMRLTAEQEYEGADLAIHRIGSTPEREVNW